MGLQGRKTEPRSNRGGASGEAQELLTSRGSLGAFLELLRHHVADLVCFTALKSSSPITSCSLSNAAEDEFAKLCEEFLC